MLINLELPVLLTIHSHQSSVEEDSSVFQKPKPLLIALNLFSRANMGWWTNNSNACNTQEKKSCYLEGFVNPDVSEGLNTGGSCVMLLIGAKYHSHNARLQNQHKIS